MRYVLAVLLVSLLPANAFKGSVVLNFRHHPLVRARRSERTANQRLRDLRCRDATSPLIEATACRILRHVLQHGDKAHISCSVKSNALQLVRGRLEGASINGRRWTSRLGLTAREVSVDVGEVILNIRSLFHKRLLEFTRPPSGKAQVVFDEQDFGNFLVHPLVHKTDIGGHALVFEKDQVRIDPGARSIKFGARWKDCEVAIELKQCKGRLSAGVAKERGLTSKEAQKLADGVTQYFNTLQIDLDGPVLSFASMSFIGVGTVEGSVRLGLDIVVKRFPSVRSVAMF
ncbi:unnamed protein product [Choristocarpus tenellus]